MKVRATGKLGQWVGERNEAFAFRAVTRVLPKWATAARRATPEEDTQGIDIVVNTDVGALFLQVKSSRMSAREFAKKHQSDPIECIVAGCDENTLRARALGALWRARARVMQSRSQGNINEKEQPNA